MATVQEPQVILYPENFDYKRQGIELPGTKRPGQTGIYRNAAWPELLNFKSEHSRSSLYEVFQSGLQRCPNEPCLGHRPIISINPLKFAPYYSWETYAQVDERKRNLGSALQLLWQEGRAGGGDLPTIGLWSQNRPEWQIVDLAAQAYAKVSVSIYDTLGPNTVEYIANHAEISVIFVGSSHLPAILSLSPRLKFLKVVVCLDELKDEARLVASSWAKHHRLEFFNFRELEQLGKTNRQEPIIPSPDQIYSICYTSGTTGNPKGAILTHGQIALAVLSAGMGMSFSEPGSVISYLPLAHIYGRIAELVAFNLGGAVGYFTGDPLRLLEDCQILRPTHFPSVPRVLNKIYQIANATGDVPGFKGNVFRKAVSTKLANLHATGQLKHAIWDRIVFRKISRVLGGKIDSITSGSAPISADALDFLKIAFSCDVFDGYGMTETAAIIARTAAGDPTSSGTLGPPQPGCEIKLVDVPEMGYTSLDQPNPRGEICTRGPVNTPGYYKDAKNTSSTIDEEKWLHTGDIGEFDSCGRLRLIDRVKNIMKLSQGEYVALEKIENAYSGSPIIGQIFVHGDSLKDYLVGIVVPDPEFLVGLIKRVLGTTVVMADRKALDEAVGDVRIKEAVSEELAKQAKKSGLRGFETIKRFHLTMDMFSTENDTLTPTLKIKRREAYNLYKSELDGMYNEPAAPTSNAKL